MALKIIRRTVSLDGNAITEALPASFFDGETAAHQFIISAVRNGSPVALSGAVTGIFLNANDETVPITGGSIVNGAAVLTLSNACYQVNGRFTLTVNVGGETVYCCRSTISRRSSSTTYDPSGVLPSISELLASIDEMETATAAVNAAVAAAANISPEAELISGENYRIKLKQVSS